jgi:hypothetical protein
MENNLFSCYNLCNNLLSNITPLNQETIVSNEIFYICSEVNSKFEAPNLIRQKSNYNVVLDTPNIILISAAGATGKTQLVNYISNTKGIPVVNLTKHPAVGSNSLTGLLFEKIGIMKVAQFQQEMASGNKGILIDALDEAYLKVNNNGFFSYLDDIVKWTFPKSSIIVLGRNEVMGYAYEYFVEKNKNVLFLQIAPFTKDQAKDFVDKQVGGNKYDQNYIKLRDYIIDSIEAFFEKDGDVPKKQKELFLGYAPVLLAVSKLLLEEQNYYKVLNDIQKNQEIKVNLILSIVEYILDREKKEKIDKLLLPDLISNRGNSFRQMVFDNCYTRDEQCYRLFCHMANLPENTSPTDDSDFNKLYNEKILDWSSEHPFLLNGNTIQNAVFESYIILRLLLEGTFKNEVFKYMETHKDTGYMFFFLFEAMFKDENKLVDANLIPYLYDSLKSIDRTEFCSSLDIYVTNYSDHNYVANAVFSIGNENQENCFNVSFPEKYIFKPRLCFSNVNFNVPVSVCFSLSKTMLKSSIDIQCAELIISCDSLTFDCVDKENDYVTLNFDRLKIDYQEAALFEISARNFNENHFVFISDQQLPHPFNRYQKKRKSDIALDGSTLERYKKLRAMMCMFRKHNRQEMGKMKDKITFRIGTTPIGKKIIQALVNKGVMWEKDHLYLISDEKLSQYLGVTYASLRSFEYNEKTKQFLENEIN